ncbi:MAG TPA: histidine kinase, partial [Methylobacter sp.]
MFWSIFKRKTPKHSSGNGQSDFPLAQSKEPAPVKNLNIPVSFLKRLMPIAQLLTEEEIQKLQLTAASFAPG